MEPSTVNPKAQILKLTLSPKPYTNSLSITNTKGLGFYQGTCVKPELTIRILSDFAQVLENSLVSIGFRVLGLGFKV